MYQLFINLKQKSMIAGLASLGFLMLSTPAIAHHPFGGSAPATVFEGFLSGMGHPIIGIDHLSFVIAAGLMAVTFTQGFWIPIAFVVTSILGTFVHLMGIHLPASEWLIAISVLAFGVLLASKKTVPVGGAIALAAIAGLFHGYAYGETVVGSAMDAVIAYLIGFATIQLAIALGIYTLAGKMGMCTMPASQNLRFAGFALAGIGVTCVSALLVG